MVAVEARLAMEGAEKVDAVGAVTVGGDDGAGWLVGIL